MLGIYPTVGITVLAQSGPNHVPQMEVGGITSVFGSAVGAFLTTLLVSAILIAVAPNYTQERMASVLEEPVGSFVYGLVCLIGLFLAVLVLVITVLGIPIAVLLVILAYLVWAMGAAVAFLAVGDRLVGHDEGWVKPILVGAGISGGLTLTGIGGILAFAVGAAGFGAVVRWYLG